MFLSTRRSPKICGLASMLGCESKLVTTKNQKSAAACAKLSASVCKIGFLGTALNCSCEEVSIPKAEIA